MATESGFVRDTFEKVLRLKEILKFLNEDKFLREHLLLKGGTAINLTVFNLPRLSVDIDMDYTPNDTREDMLECRAKITEIIKEYMESEGYQLSEASRFSHSLDAFHYNYQNAGGVFAYSNEPSAMFVLTWMMSRKFQRAKKRSQTVRRRIFRLQRKQWV